MQSFMNEMPAEDIVLVTDTVYPRVLVTMGGTDDFRDPIEVDVETFIAVKGYKAIGKRITTLHIAKVEELEPLKFPEAPSPDLSPEEERSDEPEEPDTDEPESSEEAEKTQDEMNGQLSFDF